MAGAKWSKFAAMLAVADGRVGLEFLAETAGVKRASTGSVRAGTGLSDKINEACRWRVFWIEIEHRSWCKGANCIRGGGEQGPM